MNKTQESTNQKTTANKDIRKFQCNFNVIKLDLGSLDRSYDGTNMREKQQSQSSEQLGNRINQMKYNRMHEDLNELWKDGFAEGVAGRGA